MIGTGTAVYNKNGGHVILLLDGEMICPRDENHASRFLTLLSFSHFLFLKLIFWREDIIQPCQLQKGEIDSHQESCG